MLERFPRLLDLAAKCGAFLHHPLALLLEEGNLAVQRRAPCVEQGALLGELGCDALIVARGRDELARKDDGARAELLGLKTRIARPLRLHTVGETLQVGVHRDIAKDDERLALSDALAIAHPYLAHDAAFGVLHRPPVQ